MILEKQPELISGASVPMEIAHHWNAAHQVNKAFRWALTAAGSGGAAFHEALKLYERALELWDQVDDPESLAGSHASVLMRAAYAAEDAGEIERALALMNAALDELDPQRGRSGAHRRPCSLKARTAASLVSGEAVSSRMREALQLLPDDADADASGPGAGDACSGGPCCREIRSKASSSPDRPSMPQHEADSDLDHGERLDHRWVSSPRGGRAAEEEGLSAPGAGQPPGPQQCVGRCCASISTTPDALNHVGPVRGCGKPGAERRLEMASELGLQRSWARCSPGTPPSRSLASGAVGTSVGDDRAGARAGSAGPPSRSSQAAASLVVRLAGPAGRGRRRACGVPAVDRSRAALRRSTTARPSVPTPSTHSP